HQKHQKCTIRWMVLSARLTTTYPTSHRRYVRRLTTIIEKNMAVLIDTSVLVTAAFAIDSNNTEANLLLRKYAQRERVVPMPVLVELFFLITVRTYYERAIQVFSRTRTTFNIEALMDTDLARMQQIMTMYRDSRFDFVDVAVMATSERLNIQQ